MLVLGHAGRTERACLGGSSATAQLPGVPPACPASALRPGRPPLPSRVVPSESVVTCGPLSAAATPQLASACACSAARVACCACGHGWRRPAAFRPCGCRRTGRGAGGCPSDLDLPPECLLLDHLGALGLQGTGERGAQRSSAGGACGDTRSSERCFLTSSLSKKESRLFKPSEMPMTPAKTPINRPLVPMASSRWTTQKPQTTPRVTRAGEHRRQRIEVQVEVQHAFRRPCRSDDHNACAPHDNFSVF
jgi:hypothetical protein